MYSLYQKSSGSLPSTNARNRFPRATTAEKKTVWSSNAQAPPLPEDCDDDEKKTMAKRDDTLRLSDVHEPPRPSGVVLRSVVADPNLPKDPSSSTSGSTPSQDLPTANLPRPMIGTQNPSHENVDVIDEEAFDAYLASDDRRKKKKKNPTELFEGKIDEERKKETSTATIVFRILALLLATLAVVLCATLIDRSDDTGTDNKDGATPGGSGGVVDNGGDNQTEIITPSSAPTTSKIPTLQPTSSFVPTLTPTEIPTSGNLDLAIEHIKMLFGNFTCCLDDSTSPQFKAAKWLADTDEIVQFPINLTEPTEERMAFQYRYAFAVFYYSTGGENSWDNQCNFLSPAKHVCDWNCNVSESVPDQISSFLESELFKFDGTVTDWLEYNAVLLSQTTSLGDAITSRNGILCVREYPFASNNPGLEYMPYGLRFVFNNLVGTLPTEMIAFGMYTIDLQFNHLVDTFPFQSQQPWLREVNIEYNQLSGTLPTDLHRFTSLQRLSIHNNQFTGTLPTELGLLGWGGLNRLQLNSNFFTGTLPTELKGLFGTFLLHFHDNALNGTFPIELISGTLQILVDNNQLGGTIADNIPRNRLLIGLGLSGNDFSGSIPSSIDNLPSLRHLHLDSNKFTGTIPASLGNLTNLNQLFLDRNMFEGSPLEDISWLWNLHDIAVLGLSANQFSGSISSRISNIHNASIVNLSNNHFNGFLPTEIGLLSNLFTLQLNNNSLGGIYSQHNFRQ